MLLWKSKSPQSNLINSLHGEVEGHELENRPQVVEGCSHSKAGEAHLGDRCVCDNWRDKKKFKQVVKLYIVVVSSRLVPSLRSQSVFLTPMTRSSNNLAEWTLSWSCARQYKILPGCPCWDPRLRPRERQSAAPSLSSCGRWEEACGGSGLINADTKLCSAERGNNQSSPCQEKHRALTPNQLFIKQMESQKK